MIEVAKISSQGQVTVPADVRRALGLSAGDRIAFITNDSGQFVLVNASSFALSKAQSAFASAAAEAGISSEEDVAKLAKRNRK